MKLISLSRGLFAKVDDCDYDRVIRIGCWTAHESRPGLFYAFNKNGGYMHHFIMRSRARFDHKNRDSLDNQRHNLRIATESQNKANRVKWRQRTSSKFKGVYFNKQRRLFHARIYLNKKAKNLGFFQNEFIAALAYDVAAETAFGEFACLNFP